MPVLNGKRVSLAEWRAAQNPAPVVEVPDEPATPESAAQPKRTRVKRDAAAQAMAALGITDGAPE